MPMYLNNKKSRFIAGDAKTCKAVSMVLELDVCQKPFQEDYALGLLLPCHCHHSNMQRLLFQYNSLVYSIQERNA
jgi:hypothetical protein